MKLIVDIPDSVYENIINGTIETDGYFKANLRECFESGTPLPKGHGRLIDADKLNIYDVSPADGFVVMGLTEEDIDLAPTIIEAEGSEKNERKTESKKIKKENKHS